MGSDSILGMESDPVWERRLEGQKRNGVVRRNAPRRVELLSRDGSAGAEALVLENFDRLGIRLTVHDDLRRVHAGDDCVAATAAAATADIAARAAHVRRSTLSAESATAATSTAATAATATTE